jgi:hypothetical protein
VSRLIPIIRVPHQRPPPPPAPVPTPTLGTPTVVSTSEIDVTAAYTGPPSLATFTFEYSQDPLFGSFVTFAVQSGTTAHATGLAAATLYYFRVFVTTTDSRNSGFSLTHSATTSAVPIALIKVNPGHYLWSYNISGTGPSNQGEMNNLADARSANVLGGAWIYRWGTVQAAKGVYDFSSIGTDFNYLQSKRPGARFCAAFATRVFGGPYTAATTVSAGWIPAYILNNSVYGTPGGGAGPNGTQFGYTLGEYASGSNYGQVAACIWRAVIMTEKIALFVNFLNSIVPDGSGLTWNKHPLFEAIIDWDESVLALAGPNAPPSDYSWSALMTQLEAWWQQVTAAATETSVLTALNFAAQNGAPGDMLTLLTSAYNARAGFSCPDVKYNDAIDAQQAFQGKVYNGTAWVSGGTSFSNRMDSSPQVQQPDYSSGTVAQIYSQCELLSPNRIFWGMKTGTPGDWFSQVIPVINANPTLNTTCPTEYDGMCLSGGSTLPAPTWSAVPALNFTQGVAGTYNLNAYCANAVSFALHSGTLETGVSLNPSTGVVSYNGTSPAAASGSLVFAATNATGSANSASTTSSIVATAPPPVWSAVPALNFVQGTASTYNLNSYCAHANSFALASGALETGVTLNGATGVLSYNGTSPVAASGVLVFAATNTVSTVNSGSTSSAIVAPAPVWSALPALNFTQGTAASYNLNSYCTNAASFALQSGTLETGVTLNGATGVVSYNGTSPVAASGALTFRATNGVGSTVSAATTSAISSFVFNVFVSPTGNDANPGTLTSPWAVTSLMGATQNANNVANFNATKGKSVGFLPGVYNVGAFMKTNSWEGALQIPGGTSGSPTTWASCNASGVYTPGTATINAKTGSVFGGFSNGSLTYNGPVLANTQPQSGSAGYASGYLTLDGLVFTGWCYKAIRIGGNSSGEGPANVQGVTVQNCIGTGGGHNAGDPTDNSGWLWLDYCVGAVDFNNYVHDNIGCSGANNSDHQYSTILWACQGCSVSYDTVVNAGYIWGKEKSNQGNNVHHNYVDSSMYTTQSSANGISDFTGSPTAGLTQTTNFHHNILKSSSFGAVLISTLSHSGGWITPVNFYNNTIIMNSGAGVVEAAVWLASIGVTGNIKYYNNILTGAISGDYRMIVLDPLGPNIWDYNGVPSGATYSLVSNSNPGTIIANYSGIAAAQAGVTANGGITIDAHSVTNSAPNFVGGTPALPSQAYQLNSGSPFKTTGSTDGTTGGAPCEMGAWGGAAPPVNVGYNPAVT